MGSYSGAVAICLEVVDFVQQSVALLDGDGYILKISTALKGALGYSDASPAVPANISELAPNIRPADWQQVWQLLQKNEVYDVNTAILTCNGSIYNIRAKFKLLKIKNQPIIFCWLPFSTTKYLQQADSAHQLLRISYYAINHAGLMIFNLDQKGYFQNTNEILEQKLGYQEEVLRTMHVTQVFPKSFTSAWQTLQQNTPVHGESIVSGHNGVELPVEYYISPAKIAEQMGYCGIWTDISERKLKEAELQEAFDKIKQLKDQLEAENQVLQEEIKLEYNFNNIITRSVAYKKVLRQVEQVSGTDATVLIYGETGTGKELLARTIHQLGKRAERPLVKVLCSGMLDHLLEAELFGYEKGAFNGAFQQKKGKFEKAHLGTIFLDEVAELSPDLQTKLLRLIKEGTFERMGGSEPLHVDVRVVAATSRNLEQLVRENKFRQDLLYRLNIFPIYNIPLRERREDIPLLVRHFVEKYAYQIGKPITSVPQKVIDRLMEYDFPGNVRELENIIERAVIVSTGSTMRLEEIIPQLFTDDQAEQLANFKTLEQMQRLHILEALRLTSGQISGEGGAARLLGMNDKTLYSKMKKLKIERLDYLETGKG